MKKLYLNESNWKLQNEKIGKVDAVVPGLDIIGENPVLQIERQGFNAVKVEIGSVEKWMLTNDKLSLKDFGVQGRVKVRLTLINNLRNLLGPHHLKEGESVSVGPDKFFMEPCVWNRNPEVIWDDDYCFVEMGI